MTVKKLGLAWLPAVLWMAFIFYLSQQSRPLDEAPPAALNAAGHFTEYGLLAFLLFWAFLLSGLKKGKGRVILGMTLAFALAVVYGASDEYHQGFVGGRDASWTDWGMDALGASAAMLATGLWEPGPLGRRSRYHRTVLPARRKREAP